MSIARPPPIRVGGLGIVRARRGSLVPAQGSFRPDIPCLGQLSAALASASATAQNRSNSSVGLTPLAGLIPGTYQGFQTGSNPTALGSASLAASGPVPASSGA